MIRHAGRFAEPAQRPLTVEEVVDYPAYADEIAPAWSRGWEPAAPPVRLPLPPVPVPMPTAPRKPHSSVLQKIILVVGIIVVVYCVSAFILHALGLP